jgi:hypothetical protein
MPESFDVPTYRQAIPTIAAELRRARRFEHPLTVMVVSPHDPTGAAERAMRGFALRPRVEATPPLYFLLGSLLGNVLRETDILSAAPEVLSYVVVLAETEQAGADDAARRIREAFRGCAGVELRVGTATFPADGVTLEALFASASEAWESSAALETPTHVQPGVAHG